MQGASHPQRRPAYLVERVVARPQIDDVLLLAAAQRQDLLTVAEDLARDRQGRVKQGADAEVRRTVRLSLYLGISVELGVNTLLRPGNAGGAPGGLWMWGFAEGATWSQSQWAEPGGGGEEGGFRATR